MSGSTLADAVLVMHALFIAFALGGGLLVAWWPRLAWLHLPAAAWAVWVTAMGWICPLTRLEVHLRQLDGQPAYQGGFIEHYVGALVYPEGLTRPVQVALGLALLALNVLAYARLLRARRRHDGSGGGRLAQAPSHR